MTAAVKTIAFRVDASLQMGIGHFMRCLSLADAFKKRGVYVRFVSRHMPDHLLAMLREKEYEFVLLNSMQDKKIAGDVPHSSWLCASQHVDAQDTIQALSDQIWDWLVVDHYALDLRWEAALRGTARRILVIDDLADRVHDCDVVLDQNIYDDMDTRYHEKVPEDCTLLLGPRYALLREEFLRLRASTRTRDGSVNRILVSLGGVDAENQTEKVIHAITQLQGRSFNVDVVIGVQHPARSKIEVICKHHGYQCHVQTPDVAALMAKADLAIGASGSTSWERCCLGLPTICLTHAANQVAIAKGLQARGAILNLGDCAAISTADLSRVLLGMIEQPDQLVSMSKMSSKLVDGKGIDRVCECVLKAA